MKTVIPLRPLKIGIVIATHSAEAYVALGLEALKRNEPNVAVLVHDDSSAQEERLKELAGEYGAAFVSTSRRLPATVGDLSAFAEALKWGQLSGLDVVVKCSRRMILNKPWSVSLSELMSNTQYCTACAPDCRFNYGFRSELSALHVPTWHASGAYAQMAEAVRVGVRVDSLPEAYYHWRARDVHNFAHQAHPLVSFSDDTSNPQCDLLVRSEGMFIRPDNFAAYAWWTNVMGLARTQKMPNVLWHDSHEPSDYLSLSQSMGLPYSLESFIITPGE